MWTSALDAPHAGNEENGNANASGKFVTLDAPAHLTKAFTPHGLLQAGLQDKEDRSAKKQQEIAKETGASLLNVPNKPPEPQMGLLGAITAHEKDRKAAGGLGAALTERERDRRMAVS
jgi:CCR4-NOT transcriptional complex subunit CAF120